VYTPAELARLKQFIEDSKKPLYPDRQKYSHLSGDLKYPQLKADHGWSNKSFKHLSCKNNYVLFYGDYANFDKCPHVTMISTRRKRMVEMLIMLMIRASPARSEVRRRRLTEGLL
jgi:hypothetical protein